MRWAASDRFDRRALPLADRHYNRQKVGSPQFVPPGRCAVLLTPCERALWVTSYPFARYVRHAWAGAWVNSMFRNEGAGLSSELIREAVAATRAVWAPPALGMVTFVDETKVRHKRDAGRCYRRAGFTQPPCPYCGGERPRCRVCVVDGRVRTKRDRLLVFQLLPVDMPPAAPALGAGFTLLPTFYVETSAPGNESEGAR